MMNNKFTLFCLLSLASSRLMAQDTLVHPLRIAQEMIPDGRLDEPFWSNAERINGFMQEDPYPGTYPTEQTEAFIAYNDEYLFVGVRAYDHDPSKLLRLGLERDYDINSSDGIAFVLDTYNDKSSGLVFVTNTLGARWDEEFTSDGGNENSNYNTFWDAASHVDSAGYTVEFRIPFSSLRFQSQDSVRMGFRFVRLIKRKNEYLVYPPVDPKISNPYFKVSLAKEMVFTGLHGHKPFYIIPYAIAGYTESNQLNAAGTGYVNSHEYIPRKKFADNETLDKILSNIGADIKYGLSKNFTLDLTINTDFAQAEVDNRIINLSKYEVNLPEKRGFFLESKNYLGYSFATGTEIFISRSIGRENNQVVPIVTGARVTGKSKGWQMGFLEMQTKSISEAGIDPHNFFVYRTRKDLDQYGSFVGGIVTNRMNTNSRKESYQSAGWDLVKFINRQVVLVAGMVGTFKDVDLSPFGSSMYYELALFRNAREGWFYSLQGDYIGKSFDPVMGFAPENDLWNGNGGLGYRAKAKGERKVQYISYSVNTNYKAKVTSGLTETKYINAQTDITWNDGTELTVTPVSFTEDRILGSFSLSDKITIGSGIYTMYAPSLYFNGPKKNGFQFTLNSTVGRFYGGKRISVSPSVAWALSRHLGTGIDYEFNRIDFPSSYSSDGNGLFQTNLVRLNISLFLSTKFSLKLFTQYEDLSKEVSSNLRLRYNPREGTDLYFVVNQGLNTLRNRMNPHLPAIDNQAVTIKFIKTLGV